MPHYILYTRWSYNSKKKKKERNQKEKLEVKNNNNKINMSPTNHRLLRSWWNNTAQVSKLCVQSLVQTKEVTESTFDSRLSILECSHTCLQLKKILFYYNCHILLYWTSFINNKYWYCYCYWQYYACWEKALDHDKKWINK